MVYEPPVIQSATNLLRRQTKALSVDPLEDMVHTRIVIRGRVLFHDRRMNERIVKIRS